MAIKECQIKDIATIKVGKDCRIYNNSDNFSKSVTGLYYLNITEFMSETNYSIFKTEININSKWDQSIYNDVIVCSRTGNTAGYFKLLKCRCVLDNRFNIIISNSDFVLSKYLLYWFQNKREKILSLQNNTTQPNITQKHLEELTINLPDLQTQQSIINIIEPFEKLINKIDRLINKLLLIGDYVRNLDRDDEKVSIKEICFVNIGSTPSTKNQKFWKGENPWLNSGSLTNKNVIINHSSLISNDAVKSKNLKESKVGNTLISIIEPSINKISLSSKSFFYNQSIANIEPKEKNLCGFIFFEIRKNILILSSLSTGTAQKSINKTDIENFKISIQIDEHKNKLLNNISNLLINYNLQKEIIQMNINSLINLFIV